MRESLRDRFFAAMPRYGFRSALGSGASAVVFQAWDSVLETEIAIKVLRRPEVEDRGIEDEDRLSRFKREMRLNRRLRHPGIARVYDYGEADGLPFVTMELVHGTDLRELMESEEIQPGRALVLLQGVADACAAAHAAGIVHRDLKPENVMVQEGDRTVLLDLGLSRDLRSTSDTPFGTIVGTPLYMAPEIFDGVRANARSDVFSLGLLAFEILAGEPPFLPSGSLTELMARLRKPIELRPLRDRGIPEPVIAIVRRCLERRPEERYPSALELADALSAMAVWAEEPPVARAIPNGSPIVLAVDDDPLIRRLLALLLGPVGCEVVGCENGEAALHHLTTRHVDLVLLDIVMPGMDGLDVLRVIRSVPSIARTPVVVVSSQDDRERRAFAHQHGANGFLEKPIEPRKVLQVVRNWLD